MSCFLFLFLFLLALSSFVIFATTTASAFDINAIRAQHTQNLWYVGKGIAPGDSFTYKICDSFDDRFLDGANKDECYTVRLDFYIQMQSHNTDNLWVVQAQITTSDNESFFDIFLIDPATMQINTIYQQHSEHLGSQYVDSIKQTLFYLHSFASESAPKPLFVGQKWGQVLSNTNFGTDLLVVSKDEVSIRNNATTQNVFVLEYGLFESSTFTVSPNIAFPLTGVAHDPYWLYSSFSGLPILFTFELIQYDFTARVNKDSTVLASDLESDLEIIPTGDTIIINNNSDSVTGSDDDDDITSTNHTTTRATVITKIQ